MPFYYSLLAIRREECTRTCMSRGNVDWTKGKDKMMAELADEIYIIK